MNDKKKLKQINNTLIKVQNKLNFELELNSTLTEILREKIRLIVSLEMELKRSKPLITNLDGKIIKV